MFRIFLVIKTKCLSEDIFRLQDFFVEVYSGIIFNFLENTLRAKRNSGTLIIYKYYIQNTYEECARDKPCDRTTTCRIKGKVPKLDRWDLYCSLYCILQARRDDGSFLCALFMGKMSFAASL